ncbi:hypothetical protein AB0P21_24715 [Kribbella sp. NPDC056861]|uniref:hypothetical protein n=1 Tax=Kribbella sp. NPDC056861 TaxID=3154857 RepID=UPI00342463A5
MDPDLCIKLPKDFDDSDAEAQVHPVARLFFIGRTNAEVFAQAQEWLGAHDVLLQDISWKHLQGEDNPLQLTIHFYFQDV